MNLEAEPSKIARGAGAPGPAAEPSRHTSTRPLVLRNAPRRTCGFTATSPPKTKRWTRHAADAPVGTLASRVGLPADASRRHKTAATPGGLPERYQY